MQQAKLKCYWSWMRRLRPLRGGWVTESDNRRCTKNCINGSSNNSSINKKGEEQIKNTSSHQIQQLTPWNSRIMSGSMFLAPSPQAIIHNLRNMMVGGIIVGTEFAVDRQTDKGTMPKRGRPPGAKRRQPRRCGCCNVPVSRRRKRWKKGLCVLQRSKTKGIWHEYMMYTAWAGNTEWWCLWENWCYK